MLILLLGGREAWVRWRTRKDAADATYYTVARSQRILIGVVYIGLAAVVRARHARGLRQHVGAAGGS